jgi:serine/threonine protein kinase
MTSILSGLEFIHSNNLIHWDIKPGIFFLLFLENLLIKKQNDLDSIEIADFGLSTGYTSLSVGFT